MPTGQAFLAAWACFFSRRRSFQLILAGTLYPLLHTLEEKGFVTSYLEGTDTPRPRKYYRLTSTGKGQLVEKVEEWRRYTAAVEKVLKGGETFA